MTKEEPYSSPNRLGFRGLAKLVINARQSPGASFWNNDFVDWLGEQLIHFQDTTNEDVKRGVDAVYEVAAHMFEFIQERGLEGREGLYDVAVGLVVAAGDESLQLSIEDHVVKARKFHDEGGYSSLLRGLKPLIPD